MTRLAVAVILVLSGEARAAPPEFNTEHFCADFAQARVHNMPELAKAVCVMSEESTKALIVKGWDHASAAGREACARSAGDSYVSLAKCLKALPGQ
jgi:hypothetical protein